MADEPTIESILAAGIAGVAPDAASLAPPPGSSPGEILQEQLRNGEAPVAVAEVAAVAAEVVPAVEVAAEAAPAAGVTPEETAMAGEFAQGRFRIKNDEDKAVVVFARSHGISLIEAAKQMSAAAPPQEERTIAQPTLPEVIIAKEERLAAIRADLDQRIADSEGVGLTLTAEVRALQKEEADITRELPVLQVDHKLAAAREQRVAQSAFDQQFNKWEAAALVKFPDAGVKDTPLYDAIAVESQRLLASNDPILAMEDCAFLVAARVAEQIGYKAAAPLSAPAVQVVPPVTPALPRAIGAAPGSAGSDAHRVTVASSELSPLQKFQNMVSGAAGNVTTSMADALSALANGGTPAGAAAMVTRVR